MVIARQKVEIKNSHITKFLDKKDQVLYKGTVGLLCNQTSYNVEKNEYLFQSLARRGNLKRIFLPEHGLFAELQDQVPLVSTNIYDYLKLDTEFISLYGDSEDSLIIKPEHFSDLDALVIDIQDVGSRYYTFATTVSYVFDTLAKAEHSLEVYILDRPNPCGRQVEGTILSPVYSSFVGRPGLPHKHGLTMGELCQFYRAQTGGNFHLHIIPTTIRSQAHNKTILPDRYTWEIPPSPNMPGPITPLVYTGQCLLEGTNLSEGRGTTRPFEIFGAPYLHWIYQRSDYPRADGAVLRPLRFIPTFHKHSGKICDGFQIHLTGDNYHSLAHSIKIIRYLRDHSGNHFSWRNEPYEFRSDRLAIELLAGDDMILDYLHGNCYFSSIREKLAESEEDWITRAKQYLLYPNKLYRVPLSPEYD